MLEFKISQELKPNTEILEIIKDYTYETKNGKVKHLTHTNLQFIEPIYQEGIINCPYIEDNNIVDNLLLIPKTVVEI